MRSPHGLPGCATIGVMYDDDDPIGAELDETEQLLAAALARPVDARINAARRLAAADVGCCPDLLSGDVEIVSARWRAVRE